MQTQPQIEPNKLFTLCTLSSKCKVEQSPHRQRFLQHHILANEEKRAIREVLGDQSLNLIRDLIEEHIVVNIVQDDEGKFELLEGYTEAMLVEDLGNIIKTVQDKTQNLPSSKAFLSVVEDLIPEQHEKVAIKVFEKARKAWCCIEDGSDIEELGDEDSEEDEDEELAE